MKYVGHVSRSRLEGGAFVRLTYPPFDVLVTLAGDTAYAIEDACNHAGASLSEGGREGDCVTCPMHGYAFDIPTGRLVRPLGLCDDQRTFVTRIEGDDIIVWDPGVGIQITGL